MARNPPLNLDAIPGIRRASDESLIWETPNPVPLGSAEMDETLGGGLARGALHEVYAGKPADAATAMLFALAAAFRAAEGKPVLWARHRLAALEAGQPYAPGLVEHGFDPGQIILLDIRHPLDLLRAAHDSLRAGAFGAVLIDIWQSAAALDLTASRRFALAAEDTLTPAIALRAAADPEASAAATRWRIAAAPSRALEADAPGHPGLHIELIRHRNGLRHHYWHMEWDREDRAFRKPAPLLGALVSAPVERPAAPRPAGTNIVRIARPADGLRGEDRQRAGGRGGR